MHSPHRNWDRATWPPIDAYGGTSCNSSECDVSTVEELYKDADLDDEDFDFWDYFRPRSSRTYRKRHADAVASYLEGNWLDARKGLELCLIEWSSDGASSGAA